MVTVDPTSTVKGNRYSPDDVIPAWGYLGIENRFVRIPNASPRSFGVRRVLVPGYEYDNPLENNEEATKVWTVESVTGGRRHLLMNLHKGSSLQFSSLATLARKLQLQHSRENKVPAFVNEGENLDLVELNWIADELLSVTAALHANGASLGLTDPGNIVYYYNAEEQPCLVLPDLSFVYRGPPPPPPGLSNREAFQFLWTDSDDADFDVFRYQSQPSTPEQDVRLLARMFAWVLTGEGRTDLRQDVRYSSAVWPILRRAAVAGSDDENGIHDVRTLQTALRAPGNSLADHFREPFQAGDRTKPQSQATHWRTYVLAVIILAVLIGGGCYLAMNAREIVRCFTPPPEPKPASSWLCEDCPGESPVSVILREKQEPLVTEFRQKYGYSAEDRKGLRITSNLLDEQLKNLEKQLDVIVECHAARQKERVAEEEACLNAESERFFKCLGDQWDVMHAEVLNGTIHQPTRVYTPFRDLFAEFQNQSFAPKERPTWIIEYEDTLTQVYGISLRSSPD